MLASLSVHRSVFLRRSLPVVQAGRSSSWQPGDPLSRGGHGRRQTGEQPGSGRSSRNPSENSGTPSEEHASTSTPERAPYRHIRPTGRGSFQGGLHEGRRSKGPRGVAAGRSAVLSARSPLTVQAAHSLVDLADLVERRLGQWSVGNFRAAFYVLIKLCGQPRADLGLGRRIMQRLVEGYLPLAPQLRNAYSCVAALYACAKLGYWEGGLAEAVLERLKDGRLLSNANGQDHSNLWWAVSAAPSEVAGQVREVLDISAARLRSIAAEQLTSQGCSNVLLACARLQYGKDPAFLHHVTACLTLRQEVTHQDLANSIYSLGKLAEECGHQPKPGDLQLLTGKVAERLQHRPTETENNHGSHRAFNTLDISNVLLGCAKLSYTDPNLLVLLTEAVGRATAKMNNQELANTLYALGKLGCSGDAYALALQRLVTEIGSRLRDQARDVTGFSPQDISNSVWALAKLGSVKDQGWYSAAVTAAMQPGFMAGAIPQGWSNLLYGLALVRHRPHEDLLRVMADEGQGQGPLAVIRSQASSQECANLLWALAVLGLHSEQRLVDAVAGRLGELLEQDRKQFIEQALTNVLWSLAVMGPEVLLRHSVLVEGLLREAVERWELAGGQPERDGAFGALELTQLWQVQEELRHASSFNGGSGISQLCQGVRGSQSSLTHAARKERLDADSTTSQFQDLVLRALKRIQVRSEQGSQSAAGGGDALVSVEWEYEVPELCCRVDVFVELAGGRRVAVEVDGPSHFLANEPYTSTKTGRTQLRDRQLERVFGAGNVVSVPYWEWNELGSEAAQDQEAYLRRLLGMSPAVD